MNIYMPSIVYEAPPFPEILSMTTEVVEAKQLSDPHLNSRFSLKKVSLFFAMIGIIFLIISYGPSLVYYAKGSEQISNLLLRTAAGKEIPAEKKYSYQPVFDRNLPETNSISIPTLNMTSAIHEATNDNHEEALKEGVWRVNDFGTPFNRESPTILTAHRYGYLSWSVDFRLRHSFYNLPHLQNGDIIEIVWRQRKYVYAVYKEEEGDIISDYSADLILYTCRDLNSEVRIVKYAKLLEI